MPRNMSFSLTTQQIRDRMKTVTRRRGWRKIKPGDLINACVKCMGLRPGESIERICQIKVVSVRREPLHVITDEDVWLEGFNEPAAEFIDRFCRHMGGDRYQTVTRIEFEYVN